MNLQRWTVVCAVAMATWLMAAGADARIGGGQHYSSHSDRATTSPSPSPSPSPAPTSGGDAWRGSVSTSSSSTSSSSSSSSSSSVSPSSSPYASGGSGCGGTGSREGAIAFVVVTVVFGGLGLLFRPRVPEPIAASAPADDVVRPRYAEPLAPSWGNEVRRFNRAFCEVLFLERVVLLVARLFDAATNEALFAQLSPYITDEAAAAFRRRHEGVQQVRGVTIGSVTIIGLSAKTMLLLDVRLHLNHHVVLKSGRESSIYTDEVWRFGRVRGPDTVTRTDDTIDRFGCPGCGSTLEADVQQRCVHCQTMLAPAAADWALTSFEVLREVDVGPLLRTTVEEVGTDAPTSKDRDVLEVAERVLGASETARLLGRARDVFTTLQAAWSAQQLEGMRPFETDALFQSHRFWVLEYQRQRLRNRVERVEVKALELCRVQRDGAHIAATMRITARCIDTTVDDNGTVVSGNPHRARRFSEYWTFVKHADAKGSSSLVHCPSCGAPLQVSQTGVCEHCHSKLTLGRFDWVVSRIEQDEDISGA